MNRQALITKLLQTSDKRKHLALLKTHSDLIDLQLAIDLKNTCYNSWTTKPQKTRNAAKSLSVLYRIFPNEEIRALANWVQGIAFLTDGKMENAINELDASAETFKSLSQSYEAAQTQVSKLYALALLGRYDEAILTGKAALKIFQQHKELLPSGKIEMNLGIIASRRGNHAKAGKLFLSARKKFIKLNEKAWLAMCENDLAITYSGLNDFRSAEKFYAQALESARHAKMLVTEAEIEASMGNLALFRGRFDEALRFLELSRQKYEELKMPHQTAIAELEIADIYLELNLAAEAFEIYEKVSRSFHRLKLQGEEARARANFAKAALLKNQTKKAKSELKKSARLYFLEKNLNGAASVKLTEASLGLSRKEYKNALKSILEAEKLVSKTENRRLKLIARWLHGEILRNLNKLKIAERILTETLSEALKNEQSNLAQFCLNSLGNLALQTKDNGNAKKYFGKAVKMIEMLRAPLPAEEFRMAFLADKLAPFESLAKIYISENNLEKAFLFTEKARARTLMESLSVTAAKPHLGAKLSKSEQKLQDVREELNWFYSRLNRDKSQESEKLQLQKEAKKREKQIAGLMRQIESTRVNTAEDNANFRILGNRNDLRILQKKLGKQTVLIEFVKLDDSLSAYVVREGNVDFATNLTNDNEVFALMEGLQFQFGALSYGTHNLVAFVEELKKRADLYLRKLYEKLIKPLEDFIGTRDLVIVPAGVTHYVPFHALRGEDEKYLIETREISYSPSAAIWRILKEKPVKTFNNALLIGFADEKIPLVNEEILALQNIFPDTTSFIGVKATFAAFAENAPYADLLHIACHGQFRPDSPLFSSLHLADGWITVRDICSQRLAASLVTLSACETGLSKIFAGDEILGIARGFLAAGASSLIVSLWNVNDEATGKLMATLYDRIQRGEAPTASIRNAQLEFIRRGEHPYLWAPFVLIGC